MPNVPKNGAVRFRTLERPQTSRRRGRFEASASGVFAMLGWAFTFLLVALLAAALGFGGTVGASALVAQILFVIFMALFLVTLLVRRLRSKPSA